MNDHLGIEGSLHGVSRYLLSVVPQLDPERVAARVAVLRRQDALAEPFARAGIAIDFLAAHPLDPRALPALVRRMRAQRCEVLHAQGYGGTTWARIAKPITGAAVLLHSHDADDRYPAGVRLADRLLAGRADAALANCEDARRFFEEQRRIRPTRVLWNGIDLAALPRVDAAARAAARRALHVPASAPLVASATRFRREKGNDVLVRALAPLRRRVPGVVLALVGDGPELASCRALATSLGVADALRFAGYRADAPRLVGAADVVALPSRREGSSFALLEALALGVPVVASRVGGLAEVIEEGVSGRLVPPDDPPALADALAALLESPLLRAALAEGGRARAEQLDVRRHAAELTALYEELAGREAPAA